MKVRMMDLFIREDYDEDEFGSLHDLGLTLSEDLNINNDDDMQYESRHDFGDISLSLAKDLVDEFLCIDVDSANPQNLGSIPVSDTIQSKLSPDGGIECEVIDEETNNMLLLVSDDAKSVGFCASDCDSRPNNDGHGTHLERHPKGRSKLRHIVPKKTSKVDWTPELYRSFVRAVEKLGVDNAIPSKILEIMGVRHLTRHNIAIHLQKYRSHTKHVRAKKTSTSGSWNYHPKIQRRTTGSIHRPTCAVQQAHVVAPRPTQPITVVPTGLQYVWGCPSVDHLWPQSWQASAGSSVWPILVAQPATGGLECVDAWGHPVRPPFYPPPLLTFPIAPIPLGVTNRVTPIVKTRAEKLVTAGLHPAKERVDAAIKEVLKDPFTPLPLGLKPPSIESVLSELQKRGIESMPISRLQSTH